MPETAPVKRADAWNFRRILHAAVLSAICAFYFHALDFWAVGAANGLRGIFDLLGGLLLLLTMIGFLLVVLISTIVCVFRLRLRRLASNVLAFLCIPVCLMTLMLVPLFDPWFWYVVVNQSAFEAEAATKTPKEGSKIVIIEGRDISTGLAGAGDNHFVQIVYSGADPNTLTSSDQPLSHIYGKFYRQDEYW